jgi:hypothetical protein
MKATPVAIDLIKIDHETQSRASTNELVVAEYEEGWRGDSAFPPVDLFTDGNGYYIGDGVHRVLSAARAERLSVMALVHKGGRHEAAIFACGANKSHGLKRTNADKRHAVEKLLRLEPEWADRRIAEHVGVGEHLVGVVRDQLRESRSCPVDVNPPTRVGSDGKRRKAPAVKRETAPDAPDAAITERAAKPVKNGAPTVASKDRRRAESLVGELIRLLCDLGVYQQVRSEINAVAEVVKRV